MRAVTPVSGIEMYMEEMQTKVEELTRTKTEEIRDLHNLIEMKNLKLKEIEGELKSSHIEREKLMEEVDIRGSNKGRETEQTKLEDPILVTEKPTVIVANRFDPLGNGRKPGKTSTDIVWFKGQNHELSNLYEHSNCGKKCMLFVF